MPQRFITRAQALLSQVMLPRFGLDHGCQPPGSCMTSLGHLTCVQLCSDAIVHDEGSAALLSSCRMGLVPHVSEDLPLEPVQMAKCKPTSCHGREQVDHPSGAVIVRHGRSSLWLAQELVPVKKIPLVEARSPNVVDQADQLLAALEISG